MDTMEIRVFFLGLTLAGLGYFWWADTSVGRVGITLLVCALSGAPARAITKRWFCPI